MLTCISLVMVILYQIYRLYLGVYIYLIGESEGYYRRFPHGKLDFSLCLKGENVG